MEKWDKFLIFPMYLREYSKSVIEEAKSKGYQVCVYLKSTIMSKIDYFKGYDPKRIIAVASKDEHLWARNFLDEKKNGLYDKVTPITLSPQEVKDRKLTSETLEKILNSLEEQKQL